MTNDALRIEAVADRLAAMLQGWTGSTAGTRDELVTELRDIAAIRALSADRGEADSEVLRDLARNLRNRADAGAVHHSQEWCYGVRFAANEVEAMIASGADFPECSGNPSDCPENEGRGCCRRNDGTDWPPSPAESAAPSGVSDADVQRAWKAYNARQDELDAAEDRPLLDRMNECMASALATLQPQPGRVEGMQPLLMCGCHDETQRRLCVMRDKCTRATASSQEPDHG